MCAVMGWVDASGVTLLTAANRILLFTTVGGHLRMYFVLVVFARGEFDSTNFL